MRETVGLYYSQVLPGLRKQRKWGLIVVFWFIFHFGWMVARSGTEPWEQPLIYAHF